MAKNLILRWTRIFVGGYDLSGDAMSFSKLENSFGDYDMLGWSESVHNSLSDGFRVVGIEDFQAFLNDAAARAWTILRQSAPTTRQVSVLFGAGAEPVIGSKAYLLGGIQISDESSFDSGRGVLKAKFLNDASQYSANADNPLGYVLHPQTSISATTTGTSVDNGAASTLGAHANLHVLVSSGGTWSLKIQHSTDDSNWSDLITFTATGNSVTSERKTVSGTINRYSRVLLTRTSGTVTPVIVFSRN